MTVGKSKIRICFILSHLPQGGAERQTINLIRGLNPAFYDISLLLYANEKLFYTEVYKLPVKLIIHQSPATNKILRTLRNILFLYEELRVSEFDILHTLLSHNGFWVRILAPRKFANRVVYSIRNDIKDSPGFYLLFEKLLNRKSYVVTNSMKVLEQYSDYIGRTNAKTIRNIYNGFDVKEFISLTPPPISEKVILGTVGRQTIEKNQIQILKAIASIGGQYVLHFFLIGDKSQNMASENERFVRESSLGNCITILDSVSGIMEYYKRFNIFILASKRESCPNVLFEAMLSRCLCIVSSGANSDNFIIDGVNGLVYDGTQKMLEQRIIQAISMVRNGEHHQIVEEGHNYAYAHFSLDRMISAYEVLYNEIINGHPDIKPTMHLTK
jgi:glycosyltransferase involved in cell wall biosynthesis